MYIPMTTAALVALTALLIVVRALWLRVPSRTRWLLIRLSAGIIILQSVFYTSKWATTSAYVNVIIYWLAIASYLLLVLLFSRFSPRWLTSISAAILILPLFASSFLIPLTGIFRPGSLPKWPIGDHLYYKVFPSTVSSPGVQVFDVEIYYRPVLLPFFSRMVGKQSFNTAECNAAAAFVVSGSRPKTLIARCPLWPTQRPGSEDRIVYLKRM